ncbi:MAG: hypothetical protein FWG27_00795 [Treponema sp.]|nr:hypothetical protein [Treponema sp.]
MSSALSPAMVFRRRSGWEATDMGIFLWRINWFSLLLFMGIPAGMLFALNLILAGLNFEWAPLTTALLIWWLKPLLDRFGLQVVSVRFFEPRSSFRRLFRGLGKTLRTALAGDLLWRRFSFFRSARMPLLVLERLKAKNYIRRKQILARNGLGFGLALTLICIGITTALEFGELQFLQGTVGQIKRYDSILELISEENALISALFWITLILIEMLYVCMGFGLYINSRVETEGWDIELLFKKCVEKAEHKNRSSGGIFAVIVLLFLFGPVNQTTALDGKTAEIELLQPDPVSEKTQEALDQVFDSPDFGRAKPSRRIQFKQSNVPAKNNTGYNRFSFPGLKEIMGLLLRFVLGSGLIVVLGFGAIYAYRHRGRLFPGLKGKSRITPKAAPDEPRQLLNQAEERHRAGRIREAWALCFRAFIAAFTQCWFLSFPAEATEYETLTLVNQVQRSSQQNNAAGNSAGFTVFIRRWIGFAYGGREPAGGNFEEALTSCRSLLENSKVSE